MTFRFSKKTFAYGMLSLCISSVILQLLGFIYRIGISRLAGAEGMGVFQMVMPVYAILQAITLSGLTMAVSRLTAGESARGNLRGVRDVMKTAVFLFICIFSAAAFVFIALSDDIAHSILGDERTRKALLLLLPCLFLTGFENLMKSCFLGVRRVLAPTVSEVSEMCVRTVAVMALLYFFKPEGAGESALFIVCGMIISEISSILILSAFYGSFLKKAGVGPAQRSREIALKIGKIAVPVIFGSLVNNLLSTANTVLIPWRLRAAGLNPSTAMSAFGVMFGMTMPLLMLPGALILPMTSLLIPWLSQERELSNYGGVRRKAGKALHATSLIVLPVMAFMLVCGDDLAHIIYKQDAAGEHIFLLAVATVLSFYQLVTGAVLNGLGKERLTAVSITVSGVIQLAFTWFAVADPRFGILGYVYGDIASAAVGMLMNFWWAAKYARLRVRVYNWFVMPALSSAVCALMARYTLLRAGGGDGANLGQIGSAALAGGACYLFLLWMQGMRFQMKSQKQRA